MTLALAKGLTLYFARHGQTEANVKKQFSGVANTPLTPLGREQAKLVGEILLNNCYHVRVFSRPAHRVFVLLFAEA